MLLDGGKSSRLTVLDNLNPAYCLCTAERVLRVLHPAHAGHRRVLRLLPCLLRVHPGIQLSSSFCKYYTCLFSLALLLFLFLSVSLSLYVSLCFSLSIYLFLYIYISISHCLLTLSFLICCCHTKFSFYVFLCLFSLSLSLS